MEHFDLDAITITEVKQLMHDRQGVIGFLLDEVYFFISFSVSKQENALSYFSINHDWRQETDCPYCRKDIGTCEFLSHYKKELFQKVTNHPSIRLKWLTSKQQFERWLEEYD